jgi:hypothetical protein
MNGHPISQVRACILIGVDPKTVPVPSSQETARTETVIACIELSRPIMDAARSWRGAA